MATTSDHKAEEPAADRAPPSAPRPPKRFRLWRRIALIALSVLPGLLPYPDLVSRYRVRYAARKLVTRSPWPGENTTGLDAAELAILRLLWLQRQTHRAVRGRHREAAAMLARASAETLILGLYCLHEESAIERLDAANIKALRDALRYLEALDLVPAHVIERCLAALGEARRGPSPRAMAERVDQATGGREAMDLYSRLYVPSSNFTVHASAGSLMRHVSPSGKVVSRPSHAGARRAPARVADASLGFLAAAVANRIGKPSSRFARYGDRHMSRALLPLAFMAAVRGARSVNSVDAVRKLRTSVRIAKGMGTYLWSGQAARDPIEMRTERIRNQLAAALHIADADIPPGALDPFLDHLAATLADSAVIAVPTAEGG